jgi:predicted protein tyrosine phosphatase
LTQKLLFICSQNKLRSPTAEQVFADHDGIETASAGLNHDAEMPLTCDLVEWADVIFVMERVHRSKLASRFRDALKNKRVVCLDIPDDYAFMDPALIQLLMAKVPRYLR